MKTSVNWLKTRYSPSAGGFSAGERDALERVHDVQEPAGLAALAVHRERVADHRLHREAVQRRAEELVVVEAGDEALVEPRLRRLDPVDDALVEIGRAQPQIRQAKWMLWLSCTFERW